MRESSRPSSRISVAAPRTRYRHNRRLHHGVVAHGEEALGTTSFIPPPWPSPRSSASFSASCTPPWRSRQRCIVPTPARSKDQGNDLRAILSRMAVHEDGRRLVRRRPPASPSPHQCRARSATSSTPRRRWRDGRVLVLVGEDRRVHGGHPCVGELVRAPLTLRRRSKVDDGPDAEVQQVARRPVGQRVGDSLRSNRPGIVVALTPSEARRGHAG